MTQDATHNLPQDQYWAAVDTDKLPDVIKARAEIFRGELEREGRLALWRRAERTYYGQDADGGMANSAAVTYGGDEDELVLIRVNQFASIVQGLLSTAKSKRPSFDARALSTDSEAMAQASIAEGVIDGYFRESGLEAVQIEADRNSILFGDGMTALRWNPWIGEKHTTEVRPVYDDQGQPKVEMVEQPGAALEGPYRDAVDPEPVLVEQPVTEEVPVWTGDAEGHAMHPCEIIRDLASESVDLRWAIVPYRENVWELAARYPQERTRILNARGAPRWPRSAWASTAWEAPQIGDDNVTVWWLYHLPSQAVPEGRFAMVVGDVVLVDGPMKLGEVPVYICRPEREIGTEFGHSPQFNLLALQEAYDSIVDVALSSHDAFGMQNLAVAKDSGILVEQLGKGLRSIEYTPNPDSPNGGLPQVLQLLAISESTFKLIDLIPTIMEVLSGINSVVRGDPMPQLKSGAALALVQSLAIAFNSTLQGAIVRHDERTATGLLRMLKVYARTKRVAEVVGRTRTAALMEWSATDISKVDRVAIEAGNPLTDQAGGKLEIAQMMLTNGLIKVPSELTQVLTTGRLEPIYEGEVAALDNIRRENEMLAKGEMPVALVVDDHAIHIKEHCAVIANPIVRSNEKLREATLKHINEHVQKWVAMGQELSALTGQSVPAPMPVAVAPGGAPADPNAKPGEKPAPDAAGSSSAPVERASPLGREGGPDMPLMPVNPMSGERAPANPTI